MLDWLISLDKELLLWCNSMHTPWLDNFMWMVSERWLNIAMLIPLIIILVHRRKGKEALLLILTIVVIVLLCDQIASSFFKPMFQRLRPSHDPTLDVTLVNGYTGGLYGFISSHASNTFGVAIFLLLLFRNCYFTAAVLFWAVLVSYSRIYMGVHFPGDILCGAALGVVIGYAIYHLYEWVRARLYHSHCLSSQQNPYRKDGYAIPFAIYIPLLFVTLLVIALC